MGSWVESRLARSRAARGLDRIGSKNGDALIVAIPYCVRRHHPADAVQDSGRSQRCALTPGRLFV